MTIREAYKVGYDVGYKGEPISFVPTAHELCGYDNHEEFAKKMVIACAIWLGFSLLLYVAFK